MSGNTGPLTKTTVIEVVFVVSFFATNVALTAVSKALTISAAEAEDDIFAGSVPRRFRALEDEFFIRLGTNDSRDSTDVRIRAVTVGVILGLLLDNGSLLVGCLMTSFVSTFLVTSVCGSMYSLRDDIATFSFGSTFSPITGTGPWVFAVITSSGNRAGERERKKYTRKE